MTGYRRHIHGLTAGLTLALVLAAGVVSSASAQTSNLQQQARTDQVRDQLRSSSLREQQRQQTSDTTRKAFSSTQSQADINQADRARRDRHRAQQRDRVEDYLHREQAASAATSGQPQPAHAASSH